jgi:hypothetical protein
MTSHPKRPRDPNQLAKSITDIATGEKPDRGPMPPKPQLIGLLGKIGFSPGERGKMNLPTNSA